MKRRRPSDDVRGDLADRLRDLVERWDGTPAAGHWRRMLARVEEGRPVVVHGFYLGMGARPFVRVESDGSVTPVEPVHRGRDVVEWTPTR